MALAGCVAFPSGDTVPPAPPVAGTNARVAMGPVFGRHAEVVKEVLATSGVEAPDAEADRRFVVWIDEHIVQQDPLDLLSGFTLLTIPAMRWHEVHLRGRLLARDGAVLAEADARGEACILFGWPLLLAFPLWSDVEGSNVVEEQVRGLTRTVLASLLDSGRS
jgi:hypothetical protein